MSEIVFQALFTAIISAGLVYLAFRLGQRQAREEQKEKEENELNLRRIDVLTELLAFILDYRLHIMLHYDVATDHYDASLTEGYMETSMKLVWELDKIIPLFPSNYDRNTNEKLVVLKKTVGESSQKYYNREFGTFKEMYAYLDRLFNVLTNSGKYFQNKIEDYVKDFG